MKGMRFFSILHTLPWALPYLFEFRSITAFSGVPFRRTCRHFAKQPEFDVSVENNICHHHRRNLQPAGLWRVRRQGPHAPSFSMSASTGNGLLNLQISTVMGLEALVKQELLDLGYPDAVARNGRVELSAGADAVARCNIGLRTATRVLLKLAEFPASTFDELFDGVQASRRRRHSLSKPRTGMRRNANRCSLSRWYIIQLVARCVSSKSRIRVGGGGGGGGCGGDGGGGGGARPWTGAPSSTAAPPSPSLARASAPVSTASRRARYV